MRQAASVPAQSGKFRRLLPGLIGLAIFAVALYALHKSLHAVHYGDVVSHLRTIPFLHIALSIGCMICSYALLTGYDILGLKYINAPLSWRRIAATSFSAFAISYNVGFSALSGGAIRYRAYSTAGLTATQITSIIIFCTVTFALGASALLGSSLLLEPAEVFRPLHLPPIAFRVIGAILIAFPIAYAIWSRFPDRAVTLRSWQFAPPSSRIAFSQMAISILALYFDVNVLYILLPADTGISYLSFMGIFLLAMGAGLVSNAPGGIGVFEGTLLLLLPTMPVPALLGAMLAYRVIYYLLPLAIALLIFAIQEAISHHRVLAGVATQAGFILTKAAPQILSIAVFIAGTVLLLSGNLPGIESRMQMLSEILPEPLMAISHMLGSAIGLVLLILARGLFRRLQGAYLLTLWMLALGIVVSLIKGFDYEEALFLALAAMLLWSGRHEFYRKASLFDEPFSGNWMLSILLVVGGVIWLGFFVYRHIEYSHELWWDFAVDSDAPRMLRASLTIVLSLAGFGLWRLMCPSPQAHGKPTQQELDRAHAIISQSSYSESNAALIGDKRFLFHEDNDAFIMYRMTRHCGIALSDPVGNPAHHAALTWAFREHCDSYNVQCVFYQVSDNHLPMYIDLGLSFLKLGEEAIVPLEAFSLDGSKRAKLRHALNHATREGASFEIIPADSVAPILPVLKMISNAWLADKDASEKGFSLGTFDEEYLVNFDIGVVKVDGAIVAFANLWKSGNYEEISIDLMRHLDSAPSGIMDYLFIELMLWSKSAGYRHFSLGMSPLSGLDQHALTTPWHKFGNAIFRFGDHFYNFEGLRRYKEKFNPDWEPRYLAAPGGLGLPRVLIDATTLISGGIKETFIR